MSWVVLFTTSGNAGCCFQRLLHSVCFPCGIHRRDKKDKEEKNCTGEVHLLSRPIDHKIECRVK